MDNAIVITVNCFSLYSKVLYADGTIHNIETSTVGYAIPTLCQLTNTYNVKFICDNKDYVDGLINISKAQEMKDYGVNKINYEVII